MFEAMNGATPQFVSRLVPYFDGGLFNESAPGADDGLEVLDLTEIPGAIDLLEKVAERDWRKVDPTIFGNLFEGALDESKRAQLGAHYTSEKDIRLVIDPVLMAPLLREWETTRIEAEPLLQTFLTSDSPRSVTQAETRLKQLRDAFYDRLSSVTVLDPACGSGNFLYVSLKAMKDLERRARAVPAGRAGVLPRWGDAAPVLWHRKRPVRGEVGARRAVDRLFAVAL
ncbi:MAG: class I SAM-dependent DNA methyltransferase [Chloroflexi bacterium]|nr:class I SAM-dependent DNA methyltransferase [Chloroflexota bacterium]